MPAATLFCAMLTFTILSALLLYAMIGEVNRRVPDDQQIPYFFMYPGKVGRVKREYRRLHPKGRINLLRLICNLLAVLSAVGLAWVTGFFR